jgi:hypothetical protein
MSIAGRCIARSTSSGTTVGPGIARNSRPARTLITRHPCYYVSCEERHDEAIYSSPLRRHFSADRFTHLKPQGRKVPIGRAQASIMIQLENHSRDQLTNV